MKVIESVTNVLPNLIGGSADLSGSNNTKTQNSKVINAKNFSGNYIHYGVRARDSGCYEDGMKKLYHNLIPFGGTFLIFSDYCKPAIRLSALMGLQSYIYFLMTSIGLGEDGLPINQLNSFVDCALYRI